MSSTGAKGSQQTNKRTEKGFKYKGVKSAEVCPGLAHRTVRCATGQCPVHQGLQLRTAHLREFWEALRYNSPDSVRWRTGQCPVMHRTVRCISRATATSRQRSSAEGIKCAIVRARVRAEADGAPDTEQCMSGGLEDRSSNGLNPTVWWRGRRTGQCPVAHRTVRCAMRQQPSPNG
jgi:hypothetical protein